MSMEQEIREFIVENFLFGEDTGLQEETSFLREGIVDSTGIMQLVSFIQERFDLVVEDEELIPENLDSIKRVAAFIKTKRGALQPGVTIDGDAEKPYVGG